MLTKPPPNQSIVPLKERPALLSAKEVLAKCGYPTDVITLDVETYFDADYSLKEMDTLSYVVDRRFEVLGWASKFNDDESQFTVELPDYDYDSLTVAVFNGPFDVLVLDRVYGIRPRYIVDVLSLARGWHSRRKNNLASLCKTWGLVDKGDTKQFSGVTRRRRAFIPKGRRKIKIPQARPVMTPDQWGKLSDYARNDADRQWDLLNILLPRLANPVTELELQKLTLGLWIQPTLKLDVSKGGEIVREMEGRIDAAVQAVDNRGVPATREDISKNTTYEALLTNALKVAGENPMQFMKPLKNGGWKFCDAKADEEREQLLNHSDDGVRKVVNARVTMKSWPNHISRVQSLITMSQAEGRGYLPIPLKYGGAHTLRWSGDEGVNPQNLGSRGDPLISSIRNMIVADDNQTLVIVDAAQIEARVVDWLAGETESCERWAAGEDQYSAFASTVVGYKVRKATKSDLPEIAKRYKTVRDCIGKVGVLGCGYGMGADKAVGYALSLTGIAITLETATKIVKAYRSTHAKVVQLWADLGKAFLYTSKYKRPCETAQGIRFDSTPDCDVIITLHNGGEIHYHRVRRSQDKFGREQAEVYNDIKHIWEKTWGGTLTENCVQSLSRHVLAEAMLRLDKLGHRTAFHCHDELVLPVAETKADEVLRLAILEMGRTPTWAPGLPLSAEGTISKFYKK